MSIWKSKKITLNKYEVSVIGMLAAVLLPTFVVLVVQVLKDVQSGGMNNFRIYFVTAVVFLITLIISGWLFHRYGRTISVSAYLYRFVCWGFFACNLLLLAVCYHTSSTVYPGASGEWLVWHHKTEW